jgi:hypothetical protein
MSQGRGARGLTSMLRLYSLALRCSSCIGVSGGSRPSPRPVGRWMPGVVGCMPLLSLGECRPAARGAGTSAAASGADEGSAASSAWGPRSSETESAQSPSPSPAASGAPVAGGGRLGPGTAGQKSAPR